jgi:hypothetical protein
MSEELRCQDKRAVVVRLMQRFAFKGVFWCSNLGLEALERKLLRK